MDRENLTPVTDEELNEIIEDVGNNLVKGFKEYLESEPKTPEEEEEERKMAEVLAIEDFNERIKKYEEYFGPMIMH